MVLHLHGRLHDADKDERLIRPDPQLVFTSDGSHLANVQLAK